MILDIDDVYVAGGYFVTSPNKRPQTLSPDLFSSSFLSVSPCFTPTIPHVWYWDYTDSDYGVKPQHTDLLAQWVTIYRDGQLGHPNVFFSVAIAREFVQTFFNDHQDLVILGIGLHQDLVQTFLAENEQSRPGERTDGIVTMLGKNKQLASGGFAKGFEVLGKEYSHLHTWMCNARNERFIRAAENPAFLPNASGLFDTFEVARYLSNPSHSYMTSQVERWLPWLIVQYPMDSVNVVNTAEW